MIKVSIIIPVYNTQLYLKECLDSVIAQTLKEIEMICIDDGSTDLSSDILDEYAQKDKRITVIHKENGGYGKAVNIGIEKAGGEYIGIVEPDDYIDLSMIETLYQKAKDNDLEVIKANFAEFFGEAESKVIFYKELSKRQDLYDNIFISSEIDELYPGYVMNQAGIYKRSFLIKNKIKHNETPGASYQDQGFWFQVMSFAKRMMFIRNYFYFYRQDNPNSSIASKEKIDCICNEYRFIYHRLKQDDALFAKMLPRYICCMRKHYMLTYHRILKQYRKEFIIRMHDDFLELKKKNEWDLKLLKENEKAELMRIVNDVDGFYLESGSISNLIHKMTKSFEHILIYGVGMMGKKIFAELESEERRKLIGFAVTEARGSIKAFEGIPVRSIQEYASLKNETMVIIGTNSNYHDEIQAVLLSLNFKHCFSLPETFDII